MSEIMNENDRWFAAQYALGVLEREDMQSTEKRFEREPAFRQEVEEFQNLLSPILDEVQPVQPPQKIWHEIVARTTGSPAHDKGGIWSSLSFWRGVSLLSGGLAVAAFAALLYLPPTGDGIISGKYPRPLIATLTSSGKAPSFVVRFDPDSGNVFVRTALSTQAGAQVQELWLIPDDGIPRSLGVLNDDGLGQFQVTSDFRSLFDTGGTLAVSLEPPGGSPTGAPTGPVIASGKLQFL